MSLVISVWNPKGGVGKTLSALSLAGAMASRKRRVLVVDADPQGGSMFWANLARKALERKAVREGVDPRTVALPFDVARSPAGEYDVIVYDHAPKMDLHIPGQIVVSPVVLDAVSYGPSIVGLQELAKMDKRVLVVVNRFKERAGQKRLRANFPDAPVLYDRSAYVNVFDKGTTLYDPAPGVPYADVARDEFNEVLKALVELQQAPVAKVRADFKALLGRVSGQMDPDELALARVALETV